VVNNAGFGLVGAAAKLDLAEQLAMIDLNVRVLTDLSLAFVGDAAAPSWWHSQCGLGRGLPARARHGHLLRQQSLCAVLQRALHRELKPRGVRVTVLCPGPVPTEFQARAGVRNERYPSLVKQTAEQVAQAGYRGLMAGRRLVVPGIGQQARHVPAARGAARARGAGVEAQQRLRR